MATIMSDEVFHDVAYKAKQRDHLLAGLDEFLDAVTVLPPGEWDPSIRIEPPQNVGTFDITMDLIRILFHRFHPKKDGNIQMRSLIPWTRRKRRQSLEKNQDWSKQVVCLEDLSMISSGRNPGISLISKTPSPPSASPLTSSSTSPV